jgi:hypothetical protein
LHQEGQVRITIEHREESAGLTGATKHHFVDCTVEFSEEEKAIIKARDLYNHNFTVGPATPLASTAAFYGTGFLNLAGRLTLIAGVVMFIASAWWRPYEGIGMAMMLVGGGMWAFAAYDMRKHVKRIEEPSQTIRLRQLLNRGRFTVYAPSPAAAGAIEQDIRDALATAKHYISSSAELRPKQTFEL